MISKPALCSSYFLLHADLQDSNQTASPPPQADAHVELTAQAWQEMLLVAAFLYDLPDMDIAITRWVRRRCAGHWPAERCCSTASGPWRLRS